MKNNLKLSVTINSILLFGFLLIFLPCLSAATKTDDWAKISTWLRCFFEDPVNNFYSLKEIDDLYYWMNIYANVYGVYYLDELISRHFKVEEIDENKLDILFFLLEKFSWPLDYINLAAGIEPICTRLIDLIKERPRWFFNILSSRSDWKDIVRLITIERDFRIKDYYSVIPESEFKRELISFVTDLEARRQTEKQRFEEFLKDPINNFEKVKDICFMCSAMAIYDWAHINKDKILPAGVSSTGIISRFIEENTDEKKIEILIHLIAHCGTEGLEPELIMELGGEIFSKNPGLFARCLNKYKSWRSIVYLISELNYLDPCFDTIINGLGNSEFENKLKAELEFIRFVLSTSKLTPKHI